MLVEAASAVAVVDQEEGEEEGCEEDWGEEDSVDNGLFLLFIVDFGRGWWGVG